ncbi:MAG TPA: type I methionyl aminopeptidase [Candidatus Omnitrophota bacterium]|nr:type I methionyl aminopeptidase [Candidatus Omnitrophota bacterium]
MIFIKSPEEIEKIRHACRIIAQVFADIEKYIRPGITTAELDQVGEALIIDHGGRPAFKGYRGYAHATCISVNSEVVHGIPSPKKTLAEGDVVGLDMGAIWEGYYSDMARTFPVGKVSKQAKALMKCGQEALEIAISKVKAGARLGDVSFSIENHAKKHGYSVVKDLFGHGIGRNMHEDPLIPNFGVRGEGLELRPGMTLAIEPMLNAGGSSVITLSDGWTVVTKDRSLSVHYEDSVLVTENGAEVLTRCQKKM